MAADAHLLKQIHIFNRLPEETLKTIAENLETQFLDKGEVLFRQGDPGDRLILIKEGQIAIFVPIEGMEDDGQLIRVFCAGDCLGEMSLIDEKPRSASARAETATVILTLSHSVFQELLGSNNPEMALAMMHVLCDRVRYTTEFLGEIHQWMQQMVGGDYQQIQFESEYQDHTLSSLASQFAHIATRLRRREEKLKEFTRICVEIDEAKRQQELQAIVTSEYFQELMACVDDIRSLDNFNN